MFLKYASTETESHPSARCGSRIEMLEPRIAPAILVGLTGKDALITFDSGAPEKILTSVKISGLAAGENVMSLDARPTNGVLYGLTNLGAVYTLNAYTGAATLLGTKPDGFELVGKSFAIDINPTVDRIRVVTDRDLNFRINPITGVYVDGDPGTAGTQPDIGLTYSDGDPSDGKNPTISAVAYDRNFQGATLTTLYGIDSSRNTLVLIGGSDGTPSPNGGLLTTVGALGVNPTGRVGFDVAADGAAYASLQVGGKTSLYAINLGSGEATAMGKIGNGRVVLDAVVVLPRDEIIVGVTTSNRVVRFRADNPGQLLSSIPLTGLFVGETIAGMDFRPLTGELFAFTSENRVLGIDPLRGQVIARGDAIDGVLFLSSTNVGIDFNPTVDRLRLVNFVDDNQRFNPVNFTPVDGDGGTAGVQGDTNLAFGAGDPNAGANPNITGLAYDRNDNDGTTASTVFGIDSTLNILVRLGGENGGAPEGSPNLGVLATLGSLLVDPTQQVSFDISANGRLGVGVALAAMQLQGETTSKLFTINLHSGLTNQPTGSATLMGEIGGGEVLTAMAIAPSIVEFGSTNVIVKEKAGSFAVLEITRRGGSDQVASVVLNTLGETAAAGTDFTALVNEVVTFARGETFKRIMIPIIKDTAVEPNETFWVQISPGTNVGTTVLGDSINALVTILGKKVAL